MLASRILAVNGNPLRRRVDRYESWVKAILVITFLCVDRPWARAVLNQLAYSDLIPVIDGRLAIEPFPDQGMRNATWRAHVITAGRPCLQCNGQIDRSSADGRHMGASGRASCLVMGLRDALEADLL
jgi:hypothetical protein